MLHVKVIMMCMILAGQRAIDFMQRDCRLTGSRSNENTWICNANGIEDLQCKWYRTFASVRLISCLFKNSKSDAVSLFQLYDATLEH